MYVFYEREGGIGRVKWIPSPSLYVCLCTRVYGKFVWFTALLGNGTVQCGEVLQKEKGKKVSAMPWVLLHTVEA